MIIIMIINVIIFITAMITNTILVVVTDTIMNTIIIGIANIVNFVADIIKFSNALKL